MDLEKAYDKIYRYVYFKVNNRQIAEDITQETFLRVISKNGNLVEYDLKYLYVVARNLCIDEYRRVKTEELPEEDCEGEAATDFPEDDVILRDALGRLSQDDREILLLRYVNEEKDSVICKMLGISRFALYRKAKRAEEELKKYLKEDA